MKNPRGALRQLESQLLSAPQLDMAAEDQLLTAPDHDALLHEAPTSPINARNPLEKPPGASAQEAAPPQE
ncbi:MAG: hypothetical protein ACKOAL_13425, partial [Chthoniobacterales bacterium]